MRKTSLFKKYVEAQEILCVPVVHDALCAKIAARAGFKAIASAGYSNSAAHLGQPDVSLMTLTEMVDCTWRIVDAVDLPVMADADTGHGNVTNVARTVKLLEKAGVACLFMEDQVAPKRCGHMSGKQIIPAPEMVAKLRAALDARLDPDLLIMARTDAIAVSGLEEAIARANLYLDAGADMIFVEAPQTEAQMRRITREVQGPNMANLIPGGKTPILSAAQLQEIGYEAVAFPTSCTYVIARAVTEFFTGLARTGNLNEFDGHQMHFEEFNNLVGLPEIRERERKYYQDVDSCNK